MIITHLGHSSVLVELAGKRILFDPGTFSTEWHEIRNLDAIFITHQHPDHLDLEYLPKLISLNPAALVKAEKGAAALAGLADSAIMSVGDVVKLGTITVTGVGGKHAVIHKDIPRIGNIGYVVNAIGHPVFFHPGDEIDTAPENVDILAIPAYAPWCAMKETVDFIRQVKAKQGFLIHEGLLSARGIQLITSQLTKLTSSELVPLKLGESWQA